MLEEKKALSLRSKGGVSGTPGSRQTLTGREGQKESWAAQGHLSAAIASKGECFWNLKYIQLQEEGISG